MLKRCLRGDRVLGACPEAAAEAVRDTLGCDPRVIGGVELRAHASATNAAQSSTCCSLQMNKDVICYCVLVVCEHCAQCRI